MNVFQKFTVKSLLKNRTRTFVTIIGIMLSMALFTAVIEGAYSGLQYLVRGEVAAVGAFHGFYERMDEEKAKELGKAKGVKNTAYMKEVGWAKIESNNETKPYLLIESVSDNFTDLVSVHLISGRMPANSNEILLPAHLKSNCGVSYSMGDKVTVEVGKRMSGDGVELLPDHPINPEEEEFIEDAAEKSYTVVGFYERFQGLIEDYSCPGCMALTAGESQGSYTVFFSLDRASAYRDFINKSGFGIDCKEHSQLLRYSGTFRNGNLTRVLYGFVIILIFLICFGSVSLIYNSFSISISERTKQFGLLKSVGATRKQIGKIVIFEALVLCLIAVPLGMIVGCTGIGITLWSLRDAFSMVLGGEEGVEMKLILYPVGLAISAVICVATTLISAWIPARKAMTVSPIDSIRQSVDVKVRQKDVRAPKIVGWLFGFPGILAVKNFGRNRKGYRATVFSLFLSVTLFISSSSFCAYLTGAVNGVASTFMEEHEADILYVHNRDSGVDTKKIFSLLSSAKGVTEGNYMECISGNILTDKKYLSTDFKTYVGDDLWATVEFLDDDSFKRICRENHIDSEKYFDKNCPRVLVCNTLSTMYAEKNKEEKWIKLDIFGRSVLETKLFMKIELKNIEGYGIVGDWQEQDGERVYYYYPVEYIETVSGEKEPGEFDKSKALVKKAEEVELGFEFTPGEFIAKRPLGGGSSTSCQILLPMSMQQALVGGTEYEDYLRRTTMHFSAEDHVAAYDSMVALLAQEGLTSNQLYDQALSRQSEKMMVKVVNVFSYGFIILISLIAMANVFNTIATNISLRRREFAMLRSVGMRQKEFLRMMNFECIIYGVKGLLWGLPAAFLVTYAIFRVTELAYEQSFYVPWYSVAIAVGSVFLVVFATMIYAMGKIIKDNVIDALKNENL